MNWWKFFDFLLSFFEQQTLTPPPPPDPVDKDALLQRMLLAIKTHEGWYPGSRSYRNNNPGNIRGGAWKLCIGHDDKGFCKFKNYSDGYLTLATLVKNAASGKSSVYKPTDTLIDFFARYAPASDNNNVEHYADVVAQAMGVDPDTWQIRQLI